MNTDTFRVSWTNIDGDRKSSDRNTKADAEELMDALERGGATNIEVEIPSNIELAS